MELGKKGGNHLYKWEKKRCHRWWIIPKLEAGILYSFDDCGILRNSTSSLCEKPTNFSDPAGETGNLKLAQEHIQSINSGHRKIPLGETTATLNCINWFESLGTFNTCCKVRVQYSSSYCLRDLITEFQRYRMQHMPWQMLLFDASYPWSRVVTISPLPLPTTELSNSNWSQKLTLRQATLLPLPISNS